MLASVAANAAVKVAEPARAEDGLSPAAFGDPPEAMGVDMDCLSP